MTAKLRARWTAVGVIIAAALCPSTEPACAETYTLNNGMTLEGMHSKISSIAADPLKAAGPTGVELILIVDNQLARARL